MRGNLAADAFPFRIHRWSGVWPLASEAFTFAPYCRRISNMPMSEYSQARWSKEHPSRSSMLSISFSADTLDELSEDLHAKSPVHWLMFGAWLVCSGRRITFARVKEEFEDVSSYIALTSASKFTMYRYTAFLSLLRTPSQICCANNQRCCESFGFRTNSFSAYCLTNKTDSSSLKYTQIANSPTENDYWLIILTQVTRDNARFDASPIHHKTMP